jgi:hypothetical protein
MLLCFVIVVIENFISEVAFFYDQKCVYCQGMLNSVRFASINIWEVENKMQKRKIKDGKMNNGVLRPKKKTFCSK